ncbi:MAG: EAL domain-containing protein [Eubacterium sp.]|nr:EAL domain-containing protein [Eubacterium sp.]
MSRFNEFLERLIVVTHAVEDYDREKYLTLITEICEYYGVCKIVEAFYMNAAQEKLGQGKIYCDYDNGFGEKKVLDIRTVTDSKVVILGSLYMREKDEPLSDTALYELEIFLRLILSYMSFRRLQKIFDRLGFHDADMYPNYRAFTRYLDLANNDQTLAGKLAFHFDLKNFTIINQEIGRKNGDIVMRNYFDLLSNTIGEDGIVCRLGGDKFVGVFSEDKRDRIFEIFNGEPIEFGDLSDRRIIVSASAGVYALPNTFRMTNHGDIMDKLIMCSVMAKRNNDKAVIIYDQEMNNLNERAKWVQRKFRSALAEGEFKAFYQPKVDINTRKMIGAEALCRWFHDGGIIPPLDFIPILEQGMDICDLDFYMLDIVCKDIRRWMNEGREVVKISVNLSRKHLVDIDLQRHIMEIIDRNDVPHQYIEIELTETTTDVHFRDLKRVVNGLRREGVSTAVDDFGIGYSSLNLIREVPWDVLKIDKKFLPLDDESSSSITSIMFRHVISLAQDLGMKCVVEGVETAKQVELLRVNNCDIAQGYHYDKPLPLEEFEKRLDNKVY